jgi:hypothetical protein
VRQHEYTVCEGRTICRHCGIPRERRHEEECDPREVAGPPVPDPPTPLRPGSGSPTDLTAVSASYGVAPPPRSLAWSGGSCAPPGTLLRIAVCLPQSAIPPTDPPSPSAPLESISSATPASGAVVRICAPDALTSEERATTFLWMLALRMHKTHQRGPGAASALPLPPAAVGVTLASDGAVQQSIGRLRRRLQNQELYQDPTPQPAPPAASPDF